MAIISASRRTDIPAFYADWFMKSQQRGYALYSMGNNIKKVSLRKEDTDCIVFWTKDFMPLFDHEQFSSLSIPYYVQWTCNSYGKEIEPAVRAKNDISKDIVTVSKEIGKDKIVWRYDPIFISQKYSVEYHIKSFELLAHRLSGYIHHCVISFVDMYSHAAVKMNGIGREPTLEEINILAKAFSEIASAYGFYIETCAEKFDLVKYGIHHGHCIDNEMISLVTGKSSYLNKDTTQRKLCGCVASIDIGDYNTCKHGCRYCYACK